MTERKAEHEYVDLMLDIKDGQVVSCEFFGEGLQVEPLPEISFFKPLDGDVYPRGWQRVARRIKMALMRSDGEPQNK